MSGGQCMVVCVTVCEECGEDCWLKILLWLVYNNPSILSGHTFTDYWNTIILKYEICVHCSSKVKKKVIS